VEEREIAEICKKLRCALFPRRQRKVLELANVLAYTAKVSP
jgi:hypothetical protein